MHASASKKASRQACWHNFTDGTAYDAVNACNLGFPNCLCPVALPSPCAPQAVHMHGKLACKECACVGLLPASLMATVKSLVERGLNAPSITGPKAWDG
eukprot:5864450-Alexandrium_andersonii.AAC.1